MLLLEHVLGTLERLIQSRRAAIVVAPNGQKRKVYALRSSKLLQEGRVFTADAFAGEAEADIQDIIGDGAYLDLVNRCYGLADPQAVVAPADSGGKIVRHVEGHLRTLPPEIDEFDQYRPAEWPKEESSESDRD